MLYMLALSQNAGGVQAVNDRRAVVLKLPDETAPEDALEVARGLAAEADPLNAPAWAGALGGFMSDDSLDKLDGVLWLDVNPETPEELTGTPGEGGGGELPSNQAIVTDGQGLVTELNGQSMTLDPTVEDNEVTGLQTPPNFGLVQDAQQLSVEGGTVTLSVSNGVVAAEFEPDEA